MSCIHSVQSSHELGRRCHYDQHFNLIDSFMSVSWISRKVEQCAQVNRAGIPGWAKGLQNPRSPPSSFLVQRIKSKQLPSKTPQTHLDLPSCSLAESTPPPSLYLYTVEFCSDKDIYICLPMLLGCGEDESVLGFIAIMMQQTTPKS